MTPARNCIHSSSSYWSIDLTRFHNLIHLLWTWNINFSSVSNKNPSSFVIFYLQICFFSIKKIHDFLHVNFEITAFDTELNAAIRCLDFLKHVFEHSRDQSFRDWIIQVTSFHSKRLAWTCLAISKYCSIISIEYTIDRRNRNFFENFLLSTILAEYSVESKCVLFIFFWLRIWLTLRVKWWLLTLTEIM